mgnify:CR=1 FL=1
MIILDMNQISVASLMMQLNMSKTDVVDENMVRHMILNSVRMYRTQFVKDYGEIVSSEDPYLISISNANIQYLTLILNDNIGVPERVLECGFLYKDGSEFDLAYKIECGVTYNGYLTEQAENSLLDLNNQELYDNLKSKNISNEQINVDFKIKENLSLLFRNDILKLEKLLNKDLDSWKNVT